MNTKHVTLFFFFFYVQISLEACLITKGGAVHTHADSARLYGCLLWAPWLLRSDSRLCSLSPPALGLPLHHVSGAVIQRPVLERHLRWGFHGAPSLLG